MYRTLLAALFACMSLTACQDKPAAGKPPPVIVAARQAPAPEGAAGSDASLMSAVYGERYRPGTQDAIVPMHDDYYATTRRFHVKVLAKTVLPSGETVLLTRGNRVRKPGDASDMYGEYFGMNAYFLRQVKGKWTVITRQENIARLGNEDGIGGVSWVKLGKEKDGLAVRNGTRWDKCALEYLTLFEVAESRLRSVSDDIATQSESGGMCVRDRRYSHWKVAATWRMAAPRTASPYDDVILAFSGDDASPPDIVDVDAEPTGPLVKTKVSGTARYAFDAKLGKYALVEGYNLVPTNEADFD